MNFFSSRKAIKAFSLISSCFTVSRKLVRRFRSTRSSKYSALGGHDLVFYRQSRNAGIPLRQCFLCYHQRFCHQFRWRKLLLTRYVSTSFSDGGNDLRRDPALKGFCRRQLAGKHQRVEAGFVDDGQTSVRHICTCKIHRKSRFRNVIFNGRDFRPLKNTLVLFIYMHCECVFCLSARVQAGIYFVTLIQSRASRKDALMPNSTSFLGITLWITIFPILKLNSGPTPTVQVRSFLSKWDHDEPVTLLAYLLVSGSGKYKIQYLRGSPQP